MASYYATCWQLAYFFLWILCFEELSRLAQTALVHLFSCLEQHFSHFNKHNSHQGILLKYRYWLGWSGILRWTSETGEESHLGEKDCIVFLWVHMARFIHLVSCWWTFSLSVNFCFSHYNVMVSIFFFFPSLLAHLCKRFLSYKQRKAIAGLQGAIWLTPAELLSRVVVPIDHYQQNRGIPSVPHPGCTGCCQQWVVSYIYWTLTFQSFFQSYVVGTHLSVCVC